MQVQSFSAVNVLLQIATLAGSLSLKHEHNQFPSDIFLILVTVGATLNIGEYDSYNKKQYNNSVLQSKN
jgi:hypothetical protein